MKAEEGYKLVQLISDSKTAVVSGAWVTIVEHTVADRALKVHGFEATGNQDGRFQLLIGTEVMAQDWTNWIKRVAQKQLAAWHYFQAPVGALVRVRVWHDQPQSGDYEATIYTI